MSRSIHTGSIDSDWMTPDRFTPYCDCGWEGAEYDRDQALTELHNHQTRARAMDNEPNP